MPFAKPESTAPAPMLSRVSSPWDSPAPCRLATSAQIRSTRASSRSSSRSGSGGAPRTSRASPWLVGRGDHRGDRHPGAVGQDRHQRLVLDQLEPGGPGGRLVAVGERPPPSRRPVRVGGVAAVDLHQHRTVGRGAEEHPCAPRLPVCEPQVLDRDAQAAQATPGPAPGRGARRASRGRRAPRSRPQRRARPRRGPRRGRRSRRPRPPGTARPRSGRAADGRGTSPRAAATSSTAVLTAIRAA